MTYIMSSYADLSIFCQEPHICAKFPGIDFLISQRLPFTVGFVGSMVATIYVSMVLHSYILSVFFSVLQVITSSLHFAILLHSAIRLPYATGTFTPFSISRSRTVLCSSCQLIGTNFEEKPYSLNKPQNSYTQSGAFLFSGDCSCELDPVMMYNGFELRNFSLIFSGPCSSILCHLILPWWICWNEVSIIRPCVLSVEMLWAMSSPVSCFHHLFHPVTLLTFVHIDLEIDNSDCRQCLSRYLHVTYPPYYIIILHL